MIIRRAIDKFLSAKSSKNIKKEPLGNPIRAKSSENFKEEPLVNPIRANLEKSSSQFKKSNQSEEDIFVKLEKLITYMNNGIITEKEFKFIKTKLLGVK